MGSIPDTFEPFSSTDWMAGRCTFTTMALSLPDWHDNAPYRQALGEAHAKRLLLACQQLGFEAPWPTIDRFIEELTAQLPATTPPNQPWWRVRIRILANTSIWLDYQPLDQGPDTVKPVCDAYGLVLPRPMAHIKHPDYSAETAAQATLAVQGWDDIIRLSPDGALLEGRVSALAVAMPDGTLLSPDPATEDCLNSLTLQHLRHACTDIAWPLTCIRVSNLQHTPPIGAFLLNAVQGIMPIKRLSFTSYEHGPEWTFDPSATQVVITRLAQALRPSGYYSGTR